MNSTLLETRTCKKLVNRSNIMVNRQFLHDLQIDIMLHQPHAGVARPALLVVVAHDVLVVGIRVLGQVSLNQVPSFVCRESVKQQAQL